jgi:uroporphyrinogen-III synthase
MRDRQFTILSTAALPFERVSRIPDSIDVQVIPFIEILGRTDEKIKTKIRGLASGKITAVFTSAYAVKSVTALLDQQPDWKIYCIRNETRIAVENDFGVDRIVKFADNAQLLSEQIIGDGIKEAVFFCGDQRMNILPENLKQHNIQLEELIVYETRLTPKKLDTSPDAILFFSPTAVRSFFSMNELLPGTTVFAMGTTTANALKENTGIPVIVSREADKAYVLQMAMEYAGSHPII